MNKKKINKKILSKDKKNKSRSKIKNKKGGTPWINHNVEENNENIVTLEKLKNPYAILPCGHIFSKDTMIHLDPQICPQCRGPIKDIQSVEKKNGKWKLKPYDPKIAEFVGEIYTHRFSSTTPFINRLVRKTRTSFIIEKIIEDGRIYYKICWKKKGNNFHCYFDYIDDLRSRNTKYISFINLGYVKQKPICNGFRGRNENVGIRIKPEPEYETVINQLKSIINSNPMRYSR